MAEFKCINEKCIVYGTIVRSSSTTYRLVGDKYLADERFCRICKNEMEEITEVEEGMHFYLKESFGSINKEWTKPGNVKPIY